MALRFIHTADWHIGKMLHKQPLSEEMELFFEWLIKTIQEEYIDLLLIAGDMFDLANPSIEDRSTYYDMLRKLSKLGITIIITGGNHDSVGMLNAPAEILKTLDIHVIGGIDPNNIQKEIIPIYHDDALACVVLAVPFLRDRDVRKFVEGGNALDQVEAMRSGIIQHYQQLQSLAVSQFPNSPIIGMGHLYLQGVKTSESERDITIGTLNAVDHQNLLTDMDYLALGHIHRPQTVDNHGKIKYSGSPTAMSFSERGDHKRVIIGDIINGTISIKSKPIPPFRQLKTFKGSIAEIQLHLEQYETDNVLPTYAEIHVEAEAYDPSIPLAVDQLRSQYLDGHLKIIKERVSYANSPTNITELYTGGIQIEELNPSEVFDQLLERNTYDQSTCESLKKAYVELLSTLDDD